MKKKTKATKQSNFKLTPYPEEIKIWIDQRAEYFGISGNEFIQLVMKNLKNNYTDKELAKILFGFKKTLTPRNAVRRDKREDKEENFIQYATNGLSTVLE